MENRELPISFDESGRRVEHQRCSRQVRTIILCDVSQEDTEVPSCSGRDSAGSGSVQGKLSLVIHRLEYVVISLIRCLQTTSFRLKQTLQHMFQSALTFTKADRHAPNGRWDNMRL